MDLFGKLAQSNMIDKFTQYIPKIQDFFKAVNNDKRVNIAVIKMCIQFLHESADYCPNNIKQQLKTNNVHSILTKAQNSNDTELQTAARQAMASLN